MSKTQVIFGFHAVEAVLSKSPERIIEVFVLKARSDERLNSVISSLRKEGVSVQFMNKKALDDKSRGEQHQGLIARVKPTPQLNESDLDLIVESKGRDAFILVLDGVTDPHNLGACLRCADASGVDAVVVTKDKSAGMSPTTIKVACGAAETVPLIQVTNLARTLRQLQESGIWITGTAGETDKLLFDIDFTGPTAIVMGAEGVGMRRLTREHCDELVKIPMQGTVSSLNVSVATGITLFEVLRQRSQK